MSRLCLSSEDGWILAVSVPIAGPGAGTGVRVSGTNASVGWGGWNFRSV